MTPEQILTKLSSARFHYGSEADLQEGIAQILDCEFQKEFKLSGKDRIDFLVGDVGIEVKVDGSATALLRQVRRYLEHDRLNTIIIVTTRCRHKELPASLNGKPIHVLHLMSSAF